MDEIDFISFDGTGIKCHLFMPKVKPIGIVQIVHGLEEHGRRYESFAKILNSNGLLVLASDQRLHGLTAKGELSKTKIKDVFPVMVKDQIAISDMLIEKYNLPLIIFGHSYGSFIVQSYIQKYHRQCGVVLSGSAFMKRPETWAGKALSLLIVKTKGGSESSKMIEKLVIGSFNKMVKEGSWISLNKENVKRYEADSLCGIPLCANFYYSMFKNTRKLYTEKGLKSIDKTAPILIVSGSDDPVGKMGKSTKKLYRTYLKHNIKVKLKLYPNLRHEVINEGEPKVIKDILDFISSVLKNHSK